jgi:hypothetical protein
MGQIEQPDAWEQHVAKLQAHGIPEPGTRQGKASRSDEQKLYESQPSFVDLLLWVE